MKNYMFTGATLFAGSRMLYIDTDENFANDLFLKEKLHIKFNGDYKKPGVKYKIVSCTIRTADFSKFQNVMEQLGKKILVTGNTDYMEFCQDLLTKLKGDRDK